MRSVIAFIAFGLVSELPADGPGAKQERGPGIVTIFPGVAKLIYIGGIASFASGRA